MSEVPPFQPPIPPMEWTAKQMEIITECKNKLAEHFDAFVMVVVADDSNGLPREKINTQYSGPISRASMLAMIGYQYLMSKFKPDA